MIFSADWVWEIVDVRSRANEGMTGVIEVAKLHQGSVLRLAQVQTSGSCGMNERPGLESS